MDTRRAQGPARALLASRSLPPISSKASIHPRHFGMCEAHSLLQGMDQGESRSTAAVAW